MENKFSVRVVVGSWKAYNECNERALGSKWLDMSDYESVDEIYDEMKAEGFTEAELEETFIQDYECDIDDLIENCDTTNIEELFEIVEKLDELDYEVKAIEVFLQNYSNLNDLLSGRYELIWWDNMTLADICEEYTRECNNIPEYLENYIDWESMARDWSYDGCWCETWDGTLEVRR